MAGLGVKGLSSRVVSWSFLKHFTPFFRTDPEKRKYTGALVGLGFDPNTGQALLPDHDSELVFEVEITQDDLILVRNE